MLVKVTKMSATRVPARTIQPGKEHARLVVAGIITFPVIRHRSSISRSRVQDTWHSIKEEASQDIEKMMEIPPLRGRDIINLGRSSISKTSSMSSTSKTSRRNSKT
jgi:hypothetical protein